MTRFRDWLPQGVIPAVLLPFRAINDRISPLAEAFYAPPFLYMHNRMKEVLALLGRLPAAVVRPPLGRRDCPRMSNPQPMAAAMALGNG